MLPKYRLSQDGDWQTMGEFGGKLGLSQDGD